MKWREWKNPDFDRRVFDLLSRGYNYPQISRRLAEEAETSSGPGVETLRRSIGRTLAKLAEASDDSLSVGEAANAIARRENFGTFRVRQYLIQAIEEKRGLRIGNKNGSQAAIV
jgi:hypothetical protein